MTTKKSRESRGDGRRPRPPAAAVVLALLLARPLVAPAAAAAGPAGEHPGRMLRIGETDLFVETEGSGPPLILLPAGPGLDHAYFHPHLSAIAPFATIVYFDPAGCGRSAPRPAGQGSLEARLAEVEGLRRALGFERIDLLGHGLGQAIATLYADRHPDRVRRLVFLGAALRAASFLDSPGLGERRTPVMEATLRSVEADRYLSADGRMREEFRTITPLLFHRLTDRGFQRAFADLVTFSAAERQSFAALVAGADRTTADLAAPLGRIRTPVLVVAGRYDPTSAVGEAEAVRAAVPGAAIAVLEESGAFPFVEQPVEFVKALKEFLTGVPLPRTKADQVKVGAGGGI